MTWLVYAAGTALLLALADFFVKLASGKLSNSLALLIFGSCTMIISLSWFVWERWQGVPQFAQTSGVVIAVLVGVTFTFVTLGVYATYGAGAPLSLASPLIRLSGLLLVSLAGIAWLGEPLTWRYTLGLLLACGGLYLIVTR